MVKVAMGMFMMVLRCGCDDWPPAVPYPLSREHSEPIVTQPSDTRLQLISLTGPSR